MSKHKQPVSALKLLPQGVLVGGQSREIPGQIYQGFSKVLYNCYQTEIPFFKPMGGQLWANPPHGVAGAELLWCVSTAGGRQQSTLTPLVILFP